MIQKFWLTLANRSLAFSYVWDALWSPIWKKCMKHCGKNVHIRPMSSDIKGIYNISVGDNVTIPKGSTIYCTRAELIIEDNVLLGPNPTIITGDHRIDLIGKHINEIADDEKLPCHDLPVVIKEGVWCGANVTILKGVTIGKGSVVAAGAVVTHSFPPYSIIGGVPAKLIRNRFSPEQIVEHERILNEKES